MKAWNAIAKAIEAVSFNGEGSVADLVHRRGKGADWEYTGQVKLVGGLVKIERFNPTPDEFFNHEWQTEY